MEKYIMSISTLLLILVAGIPFSLAQDPQTNSKSPMMNQIVEIANYTFQPDSINITVGMTITWINRDFADRRGAHTVTAVDGTFDSGGLNNGEMYNYTFNRLGTFDYYCKSHPSMKGTVNVIPGMNHADTAEDTTERVALNATEEPTKETAAQGQILETLNNAGNLTKFSAAIAASGLVNQLDGNETQEGALAERYMIFAPNDMAFSQVPEATMNSLLINKSDLQTLLKYHLVNSSEYDCCISRDGQRIDPLYVTLQGESLLINDIRTLYGDIVSILTVNSIEPITTLNYENGEIHVIDRVLLPKDTNFLNKYDFNATNYTQSTTSTQEAKESLRPVQADEILAKISNGEPVEYNRVIIDGDLRLSGITPISSAITITNSVINGRTYFNETIFDGAIDFSGSQFNSTVDFSGSQFNYANFMGTKFRGDADFSEIQSKVGDFSSSQFDGTADFSGSRYSGNFWADRSKFNGAANFSGSKFLEGADISRSQFNMTANFSGSEFYHSWNRRRPYPDAAHFTDSKFADDVYFRGSQFKDNVYFSGSQFNGSADFTDSSFASTVSFFGSQFRASEFEEDVNFIGSQFNGTADFRDSYFARGAHFYGSQFRGHTYL